MKYIDLFAGCGGLSLGLASAGFELELAVEKSPMAAETYYHNFIRSIQDSDDWDNFLSLSAEKQFAQKLMVSDIQQVISNPAIMDKLKGSEIDLVAGGPPCQGFSVAGRRDPHDERNKLPWLFLKFVQAVRPKAVIMENVVGIRKMFTKHGIETPVKQLIQAIHEIPPGYAVQPLELDAAHFGIPQNRPRVMLVAVRMDVARKAGISTAPMFWKSSFAQEKVASKSPLLAPVPALQNFRTVRDALWDIGNRGYTINQEHKKYGTAQGEFAYLMRNYTTGLNLPFENRDNSKLPNHRLRNHEEKIVKRFRLIQYLDKQEVPSKIITLASKDTISPEEITSLLEKATYPAVSPDKEVLAHTPEELATLILELKTKKHSQRCLSWSSPSPTVLSLPDDFVHPAKPRTMTIREMARLQSFPDTFVFRSKETTGGNRRKFEVPQYTQVGNAVPPLLAKAIGEKIAEILFTTASTQENNYQTTFSVTPPREAAVALA